MLAALICFHAQATAPAGQPKAVDVVGYQQVLHALPNGAPDPAAPDNFYVRVSSHYELLADSDAGGSDANGTRNLHVPGLKTASHEWYEETGKASEALSAMFKRVTRPTSRDGFRKRATVWSTLPPQDQPIYKGNHAVVYERHTTLDRVEKHTLGKRSVTRIQHRDDYNVGWNLQGAGTVFDPSANDRAYWSPDRSEVRVDPTVYRY